MKGIMISSGFRYLPFEKNIIIFFQFKFPVDNFITNILVWIYTCWIIIVNNCNYYTCTWNPWKKIPCRPCIKINQKCGVKNLMQFLGGKFPVDMPWCSDFLRWDTGKFRFLTWPDTDGMEGFYFLAGKYPETSWHWTGLMSIIQKAIPVYINYVMNNGRFFQDTRKR